MFFFFSHSHILFSVMGNRPQKKTTEREREAPQKAMEREEETNLETQSPIEEDLDLLQWVAKFRLKDLKLNLYNAGYTTLASVATLVPKYVFSTMISITYFITSAYESIGIIRPGDKVRLELAIYTLIRKVCSLFLFIKNKS